MKRKVTGDWGNGLSVVWSGVNRAYFVLFGSGPVAERSVLAVLNTAADVLAWAADRRIVRA